MIRVLMETRRKILSNTLRTQPTKNYAGYVISIVILALLLYFLSKGVWAIGDSITEPILAGILSYGFLMIIGLILLLGLPQVFKHLYAATDLALLFTLPIPTRHIFWMKYVQSFVGIPLLCFVFFVVPLFVYGLLIDASLLFYPIVIFTLLAIIVIGLSIAYLLNLGLIQLVPANRANELMTVMSVLSGLLVYLMFMIPNLTNDGSVVEKLLSGLPLFPDWVPVSWGSDALIHAANGSMDFLLPFVLLVLLAIFAMVLTSTLVEKGFRTGWIRLSEGSSRRKKSTMKKSKEYSLHNPVIAIGIKEWFAIKRDMREWLVFMPIAFFIIFPLIGFFSSGAKLNDLRDINEVSWPIAQGAFLFIYAVFNGPMAASSIAREGSSVWILRTLPLSGQSIALGKLWISWLLPFILLTVIECIIGIFLGWTVMQFATGIIMKAVITTGISAIGLWLGTIGAKYNPKNPQNRLKFGTSLILLVLSYVYLFLAIIPYVLLIVPANAVGFVGDLSNDITGFFGAVASLVFTLLSWKADAPVMMGFVGVLAMLIISIGAAALFTLTGGRKIDKGIDIEMVHESNVKPLFKNRKPGGRLY
ncbi:putative ABC transporter permease subunit [Virgibacillus ndiopensis]|uniref:putative ABC transporter permease subunit n=1 Tax=Virgibacillus ndiopensis TaxID=2004408 RepID=UPI000C079EC3|nr:hypothetical protein [Virgibacillus ndiopensis]